MEQKELKKLVLLAQQGNREAMGKLFTEYYPQAYILAVKLTRDEELAMDIVQDAFADVIKHIGTLKQPEAFSAWLNKITYNQCTRYFKKKKELLVTEEDDGGTLFDGLEEERPENLPEPSAEKEDLKRIISQFLDSLPEPQRAAVIMYYFEEMSVKEISYLQNATESTVKARLFHGRNALRAEIEKYEKRNSVKLHSVALIPLLRWCMDDDFCKKIPSGAAENTANAVLKGSHFSASATVAAGKSFWTPLALKIAAIPMATAVVVGGAVAVNRINDDVSQESVYSEIDNSCDTSENSGILSEEGSYDAEAISKVDKNPDDGFDFDQYMSSFVPDDNNTISLPAYDSIRILEGLFDEARDKLYSSDESMIKVGHDGWLFSREAGTAYVAYVSGFNNHIRIFRVEITE